LSSIDAFNEILQAGFIFVEHLGPGLNPYCVRGARRSEDAAYWPITRTALILDKCVELTAYQNESPLCLRCIEVA
jgi:hypothetical protein